MRPRRTSCRHGDFQTKFLKIQVRCILAKKIIKRLFRYEVFKMLKAEGTTLKGFTMYVVGEGIEKKADDFAAEVAAQVAAAQGA